MYGASVAAFHPGPRVLLPAPPTHGLSAGSPSSPSRVTGHPLDPDVTLLVYKLAHSLKHVTFLAP